MTVDRPSVERAPEEADDTARPSVTLALAHALRTPLTSLTLGLGALGDGTLGPLNEAQTEVVRALVADAARLALVVDRALRTDRLGAYAGPVERIAVDLCELVRTSAQPIAEQARDKGIFVVETLAPGVIAVADPVKIAWVVTTLLGNALRYSPQGSSISVTLGHDREHAELRIEDHGPGLPLDLTDRVFERDGGGGLFLVREIVEAHGGRVGVRSEAGVGCVFSVALPLAKRAFPHALLARAHRETEDTEQAERRRG